MKKLSRDEFYKEARTVLGTQEEPGSFDQKFTIVEKAVDYAVENVVERGRDETELILKLAWEQYQRLFSTWGKRARQ